MLFQQIAPPHIVVVLEADFETSYTRRTKRNRQNDNFTPESVRLDIENVEESLAVMEHIRQSLYPPLRVLRVQSNEGNVAGTVAEILGELGESCILKNMPSALRE